MSAETGRKGPSVGRNDILTQMLDYSIKTFYEEVSQRVMVSLIAKDLKLTFHYRQI